MKETRELKKGYGVRRLLFAGLAVLVQLVWLVVLYLKLNEFSVLISITVSLIAVVIVLHIYGRDGPAGTKLPWIILISAFPFLGVAFFLLSGYSGSSRFFRKRFAEADALTGPLFRGDPENEARLRREAPDFLPQAMYLEKRCGFPVYGNTEAVYFPEAGQALDALAAELEKAEEFIFMEYYAIEDGEAFARLKEILTRKASQGVKVRILYDDYGSVHFLRTDFPRELKKAGIECWSFNPLVPLVVLFMNDRDHRKFTVIDGKTVFTGGYNLADKYFDIVRPYGHWKDTGVMLRGEAANSFTLMFLNMWAAVTGVPEDPSAYLRHADAEQGGDCWAQPFADTPVDTELICENVYMNVLKKARERVWFLTPYLALSDEMKRELEQAAGRGLDVRIVLPGIPDSRFVHRISRSYYYPLAEAGVRIYEYTPGFCHAKMCVADGDTGVVGTANLDFRSLYLNFEDAVLLHGGVCEDVEKDFEEIFPVCEEVTGTYRENAKKGRSILHCLYRIIAPLF